MYIAQVIEGDSQENSQITWVDFRKVTSVVRDIDSIEFRFDNANLEDRYNSAYFRKDDVGENQFKSITDAWQVYAKAINKECYRIHGS